MSNNETIFLANKLDLINYRNYDDISFEFNSKAVFITGDNGVGKTNILEALSLLSPGKGLRNAKISELYRNNTPSPWHVRSLITSSYGNTVVNISAENNKKIIQINGKTLKTSKQLNQIFDIIWLTPQMDGIFINSTNDRRKFFDRLVFHFDYDHAERLNKYDYFVKERNRILKLDTPDHTWLNIIERKICELGIAIATSRKHAENFLNQSIQNSNSSFPKARIIIEGEIENKINSASSLEVEEQFLQDLYNLRNYDSRTGKTSIGPHRSNMAVYHIEKNMPANLCSTGEQKSLLISIILAEAKAKKLWDESLPVILLDEVTTHLDKDKQQQLFAELIELKAQFFITSTSNNSFKYFSYDMQHIIID